MKIKTVDTVHFGIDVIDFYEKAKNLLNELKNLKKLGQEVKNAQQIRLNELLLTVELAGARFYAYRLTCKDFTVLIADMPVHDNPPVKVQFSSGYLWSYGYKQAYDLFSDWFQASTGLKISGTRISRLDICVDTDECSFNQSDILGVVTYSKSKTLHYVSDVDDVNYSGRSFTGLTIGRGKSILCRIYDKTREIQKSGKDWFKDIWQKNEWNEESPVWRVEFQLRRNVLKEFGINSVEDTFSSIDSLWKYLTTQWLQIKNPDKNQKVTYWKNKKKWQIIQSAVDYDVPVIARSKVKKGNLKKLMDQVGGLLISISAAEHEEMDIDDTVLYCKEYLLDKLKMKRKRFDLEVIKRKSEFMEGIKHESRRMAVNMA
jgi:hypothetical protein